MKQILKFIFFKIPLVPFMFSVIAIIALKWLPVTITPIMIKRAMEFRQNKNL